MNEFTMTLMSPLSMTAWIVVERFNGFLDGGSGTHASSNVSKTSLDVGTLSPNALSSRFRAVARACVEGKIVPKPLGSVLE